MSTRAEVQAELRMKRRNAWTGPDVGARWNAVLRARRLRKTLANPHYKAK